MLIVCWNVAGLATTVHRIQSSYGSNNNNSNNSTLNKKRPTLFLSEYMKRHNADIFCIQEHKIPLSQLSTRSEPLGCSNVEGYESFWSCCVDPKKKGFNGVVTYVKKGLVVRADSKPLGSPDLDDQGRCVMTDHGSFVLFNVYVPASSGQPLWYKMKFLNALRQAMRRQREQYNKKVILVGDLNISHRPKDKYWGDRVLFVNDVLREVAAGNANNASIPRWKQQLASAWEQVELAMRTKKVVETQTTNSLTNQKYEKYRMTVQVNNKTVYLGSHEGHPDYCEHCYDFSSWEYTCRHTGESILAEEENVIAISTIAELIQKIAGIEWDEDLQRHIAATAGGTSRMAPPRRWLNSVIDEDGMVDAFEYFYPDAEGRFTCWHQFTNKRYTNEGARIDFTLVDSALVPLLRKGQVQGLRCGCNADDKVRHDPNSDAAALCAATANGGFRPVPFVGGGIEEAARETLDTQFGPPHTGMIYTPPSFSDHTAISLLLDDQCIGCQGESLILEEQETMTRKAQPHKSQQSISSFFTAPTGPVSSKLSMSQESGSDAGTKRTNDTHRLHAGKVQKISDKQALKRPTTVGSARSTAGNKPSSSTKAPPKGSILHHFTPKK